MAAEPLAAPSVVPPMNRYAGQIVGFAAPLMQVRYPAGVYVSLAGFPTWIRYARAIVELPPTAPTETMCRIRVTDVAAANELMARTGDPLWQPKQEGVPVTPDGWQWAHLAKTRRIALLPGELATAFRHWGGMATLRAEPDEVGLRTAGGGAVEFVPAEQAAAEADLVKLEQEIGHPLPAAYREFVTRTNGGRPAVPAVHPSFGFVVDQSLFTVTGKDWLRSLRYVRRWVTDRFTDDFLPIGRVQGGMLALRLTDPGAGSVWFWDGDDRRDDDRYRADVVSRDLLHRCGDGFDTFLRALLPFPADLWQAARQLVDSGQVRQVSDPRTGTALPANRRPPGN